MAAVNEYAKALAGGIVAALPGWLERSVAPVRTRSGRGVDGAVHTRAQEAGRRAGEEVGERLRRLLDAPFDEQRTTPLPVVRDAVRYPTAVLRYAAVPAVARDEFGAERLPDDPYDLTPASLAELDPALVDVGLAWGATKAMARRNRHGS